MSGTAQRRKRMKTETIYFFHLDELREENKMSIDDFIENICSLRQYWRYKNGENLCPQEKFSKLLEKLNLSLSEFENYVFNKSISEYPVVQDLYRFIFNGNEKQAKHIINKYIDHHFTSYETKTFFNTCVILFDNTFAKHSDSYKLENYSKYIDYPKCINRNHITFTDIVILQKIAELEIKNQKRDSLDFLKETLLQGKMYLSGNSRYYLPSVYVKTAKLYGVVAEYSDTLEICKHGINYSLKNNDVSALPNLYYLSCMAKFKLGLRHEINSDLARCLITSCTSEDKYRQFLWLFQKNLGYSSSAIEIILINHFKKIGK